MTILSVYRLMSDKVQTAKVKIKSSIMSRILPGVATKDFPDLLPSFGTVKVAQIAARVIGIPVAIIKRIQLSLNP